MHPARFIATVASAEAGADGNYSNETPAEALRPLVEAAGAAGIHVVLDLQPGRTDFLTRAKLYESLLVLPHVGLALGPEWRLLPDEVHLRQIGSVSAAEVNQVVLWLADLTAEHSRRPGRHGRHVQGRARDPDPCRWAGQPAR